MDEGLQLQLRRGFRADFRDLVQGQLPGQHHPAAPRSCSIRAVSKLTTPVWWTPCKARGRVPQGQTLSPQIRRDDPVGAAALQEFKISGQRLHLPVAGQDVDGDVDLPAGFVRQRHGMPQAFLVKIGGADRMP